ncbi:MAG: TIR domain-containing protein [Acidobacteriota bacterium]|nr:TIR domain-containing protein [Acidobacteriota bacterium]
MTHVFISYSHDSPHHKARVAALARQLIQDGLTCELDQFIQGSPPDGWPRWMNRALKKCDFVLVVCTRTYHRRVEGEEEPGRGLGVQWEALVTTNILYETAAVSTKFIPVVFDAEDQAFIPVFLRQYTWYLISSRDGYEQLYRCLTDQPLVVPPEKGAIRRLPPKPPPVDLFEDREEERPSTDRGLEVALFQDDVAAPMQPSTSVSNIPESGAGNGPGVQAVTCPFPGLAAFREEDREFFFGREPDIDHLVKHMQVNRFLALLGPSGVGKSSILQAGLIPALREDSSGGRVLIARCSPRTRPLEELALGFFLLARGLGHKESALSLHNQIRDERMGLHFLARELCIATDAKRLVIVVDQFEEVFTQVEDAESRRRFIDRLLVGPSVPYGPISVILSLRSDFLGMCAPYPELNRLVTSHLIQLGTMDDRRLRMAVENPARACGLVLEPGLVERILADAGGAPGELPLVAFALMSLFELRSGNQLTQAAYDRIGGIAGALTRRAEEQYALLPPDQKEMLRRMFVLRLVRPGDGTEDTRKRTLWKDLVAVARDPKTGAQVLEAWVNARLLSISGRESWVEVSHEALIRRWPRLVEWMDNERETAHFLNRLADAAGEWRRKEMEEGYLYRGAPLKRAEELLVQRSGDLTPLETDFIRAGLKHREAEVKRQEELDRMADELLAAQRKVAVQERRASVAELVTGTAHQLSDPLGYVMQGEHNLGDCLDRFQKRLIAIAGDDADNEIITEFNRYFGALRESLKVIKKGTATLHRLTRQLQMRSSDAGRHQVDLTAQLRLTLSDVRSRFGERVDIEEALGDPLLVECQPGELGLALMHLMVFACRMVLEQLSREAYRDPGSLRVASYRRDQRAVVRIEVIGCELSESEKAGIYRSFYTTGIVDDRTGLNKSYRIILDQKGSLQLEDRESKGIAFLVELPEVKAG